MSLETYIIFIIAATFLILAPGPSIMMVVSHAMSLGVRNSLFTIAGIALSDIFFLSVTALGLVTFIIASASFFPIIKWCGVAYLIWLGIQQWPRQEKLERTEEITLARPWWSLFLQGFAVNTTNPKAIVFYAAFFPPFLNPDASIVSQLLILLITFIVILIVVSLVYAVLAAKSSNFFSNPEKRKIQEQITALLLIGAGVVLGLAE